jgi:O-antigen/teichoic acid export membrane protein
MRIGLGLSQLERLATQVILLAPSLFLSIAALAVLPTREYALWGTIFSLSSAAILLDGGAATLGQVYRAEGALSAREILRLLAIAGLAPTVLTAGMLVLWQPIEILTASQGHIDSRWLPLLLGAGTVLRSWQNVANGITFKAHTHRRLVMALLAAATQLAFLPWMRSGTHAVLFALAYTAGAIVGLVGLIGPIVRSVGQAPRRGGDAVATRSGIALVGALASQGDRIIVAAVSSPAALAAYDLAARIVSTASVACIILSFGLATEGSRWSAAGRVEPMRRALRSAQMTVDFACLLLFTSLPFVVYGVTEYTNKAIQSQAVVATSILTVGYAVWASTTPMTNFLSGARILRPEKLYTGGTLLIGVITVPPLGILLGMPGAAAGLSLALFVPSVWLRMAGHGYATKGEGLPPASAEHSTPSVVDQ